MSNNYFHNNKSANKNEDKRKSLQMSNTNLMKAVDINILLNRVKIEKKTETKRQIVLFSFVILLVGLLGTLIIIK
jgi:hypothetical protein